MSNDQMKENGLSFRGWGARSRYFVETIINALALFANTPAQVKSLLHCLQPSVRSIGRYVNSDKQDGAIAILNGKPLKLVDQFSYFGSNISSIEKVMSIYAQERHRLLLSGDWSFGNLMSLIKLNRNSSKL